MKKTKVDARWFRDAIAASGLTQRRLAAILGITPPGLSLSLSGKRKFTGKEVVILSNEFRYPADVVLIKCGHGTPYRAKKAAKLLKTTTAMASAMESLRSSIEALGRG